MAVCLRKIPGLNKVKLIDAVWIWTEPHSMRLKIKLTIQKEVINGAVLQQAMIIEFTIRNQQCTSCQASFATGTPIFPDPCTTFPHVPNSNEYD